MVDYKTGSAPRPVAEARALFQMKFYALALLCLRGVMPTELRLLYLTGPEELRYVPDEAQLRRFAPHPRRDLDRDPQRGRHRRLPAEPGAVVRVVRLQVVLPGVGRGAPALPRMARRRTRGSVLRQLPMNAAGPAIRASCRRSTSWRGTSGCPW